MPEKKKKDDSMMLRIKYNAYVKKRQREAGPKAAVALYREWAQINRGS